MMKTRVYNFGAGPAMIPESILLEAQEELMNWHDEGMSILEIGHRTKAFTDLMQHAELTLRELLKIPEDYQVLFLGGAARTQFAMIPLNFLAPEEQAGYIITGVWSQMAFEEAQRLKKAYSVASGEGTQFKSIPAFDSWDIQSNTSYLYFTPNETVNGVRFPFVPKLSSMPLIADMTSCLLSEPIDITQYDLIFAGAQKNIANAGMTVVIVKNELLEKKAFPEVPSMLSYPVQAQHRSLYATPPVFNCYLADKMFSWVKEQGGIEALYKQNCIKSDLLYQYIDSSNFYFNSVAKEARSLVNVCFLLKKPELEAQFIALAHQRGLVALAGHRTVGGLRASLYNAMPISGVEALIEFMSVFAKENN